MDRLSLIDLITDRFSARPGHLWTRVPNPRDAPVRTRTRKVIRLAD